MFIHKSLALFSTNCSFELTLSLDIYFIVRYVRSYRFYFCLSVIYKFCNDLSEYPSNVNKNTC